VLVTRREDKFERYVTRAPLIAIEILSPEDRLAAMQVKAGEYREFGVENVWIIDPERRVAYRYTGTSLEEAPELAVPGTPIQVDLDELFAELDRA
jgi:Uma2 family endonuclease